MYSYSTSCVKINDKLTEFFATKLGVKQGDNLIPNLFKIFINDLPSYLHILNYYSEIQTYMKDVCLPG
jgi:hypothetical protein